MIISTSAVKITNKHYCHVLILCCELQATSHDNFMCRLVLMMTSFKTDILCCYLLV